ncbi:MAG: hypothetical protein AB7L66_02710 [Gemmatimonadales bacterium]
MGTWLRRLRGAFGMGMTWAVGWAGAGLLIGVVSLVLPLDWFFRIFDAPLPALAIPGFLAGVLFSLVLAVAGRHRRFSDLSLPRVAAWGAAGGLGLSLLPAALAAIGLASLNPELPIWRITLALAIPSTILGALSAAATLTIARRGEERRISRPERESDRITPG